MKINIVPGVSVQPDPNSKVGYLEATEYVAMIIRKNTAMLEELTPKAIEKYGLTKTAAFYNDKVYANLKYVDIKIDKLVNDMVKIDHVLCVDETYMFKELSSETYGFLAICMPYDRTAVIDDKIAYTVDNIHDLISLIPDSFRNLYKNVGRARLDRLEG